MRITACFLLGLFCAWAFADLPVAQVGLKVTSNSGNLPPNVVHYIAPEQDIYLGVSASPMPGGSVRDGEWRGLQVGVYCEWIDVDGDGHLGCRETYFGDGVWLGDCYAPFHPGFHCSPWFREPYLSWGINRIHVHASMFDCCYLGYNPNYWLKLQIDEPPYYPYLATLDLNLNRSAVSDCQNQNLGGLLSDTLTFLIVPYDHEFGDLNCDGDIGLADLATLLSNYGREAQTYADGDMTGDERVELDDVVAWLAAL